MLGGDESIPSIAYRHAHYVYFVRASFGAPLFFPSVGGGIFHMHPGALEGAGYCSTVGRGECCLYC